MAIDAQSKKITLWAENGDRVEPSDIGIDESEGWTVGYEQQGSGQEPEREVFNTMIRRLSGWYLDWLQGGFLSYDVDLFYQVGAFVRHNAKVWTCIQANGPGGTVVEPGTDAAYWKLY